MGADALPSNGGLQVAVVVDSAASLPADMARDSGLHVVPMGLTVDGTSYLDGRDLSPTEFYRLLTESPTLPSTSAPSPARFLEAFRQAAETAPSILCLTVSSNFSATFDSAKTAAAEAGESLPDVEIRVLDTGSAAGGEGLIALEACRSANRGAGLDEVASAVESVITGVRLMAFVDTLYYLWKGGRVSKIAHAGTSLLKIKPLFELSQGQVRTLARPRTHRRAMNRLVELMRQRAAAGRLHATIMHADSAGPAEELRAQIAAEFDYEELFVSEFTPVMGVHIGPGLLGIAYWNG